jgi:hypothetical protein
MTVKLTCEETPLAWPASVPLPPEDHSCSIKLYSPTPGSLQVLSRRTGAGNGEGVTIQESTGLGADYRGQCYTFEEAIFYTPGLHVFPGQKESYAAEYHLYMRSVGEPTRFITVVFPVSHHETHTRGEAYFAAIRGQPDGSKVPSLETLLTPSAIVQYEGPDLRGRPGSCQTDEERHFLLVLDVLKIRATDLNRIYSEGSLSDRASDMPAPGPKPSIEVPRDRLMHAVVYAKPGIILTDEKVCNQERNRYKPTATKEGFVGEMAFKPIIERDGKYVVDTGAKPRDASDILGITEEARTGTADIAWLDTFIVFLTLLGAFAGLYIADVFVIPAIWSLFFTDPVAGEFPINFATMEVRSWSKLALFVTIIWTLARTPIVKTVGR